MATQDLFYVWHSIFAKSFELFIVVGQAIAGKGTELYICVFVSCNSLCVYVGKRLVLRGHDEESMMYHKPVEQHLYIIVFCFVLLLFFFGW